MEKYSDLDFMVFAKTIFAEGNFKSLQTKEAIALSIINNFNYQNTFLNLSDFCCKYDLYKFWNDAEIIKKLNKVNATDAEFALAVRIAKRAIVGVLKDFTFGSTHYHYEFEFPNWAKNKGHIFQSDCLLFYNNIY